MPKELLENPAALKAQLEALSLHEAPYVLEEFMQYLAYTQTKPIKKFIQHDTDAVAFGDLWKVWEIIPAANHEQPFFSTNFSEFCNNVRTSSKGAFRLLDYWGHDEYKNLPDIDNKLKQNIQDLLGDRSAPNYRKSRWLYPVSAGFLAINCEPFHKILTTCSFYLTQKFAPHHDEEDFLGQIHYAWIRMANTPIFTLPYAYNSRPNAPLCAQLVLDCLDAARAQSKEAPSPDFDQLYKKGKDFVKIIKHNPQLEDELKKLSRGNIIFLHPDSMSKIYSPWPAVNHLSEGNLPSQLVVKQYDNFAERWLDCINGLILKDRVIALDYVNRCVKRVNESLQAFQAEWAKELNDLKANDERATQENGGQKTTSQQDRFLQLFPKPKGWGPYALKAKDELTRQGFSWDEETHQFMDSTALAS